MSVLEVANLQKVYKSRFSSVVVEALSDVTFSVEAGNMSPSWGRADRANPLCSIFWRFSISRRAAPSKLTAGKLPRFPPGNSVFSTQSSWVPVSGLLPARHVYPQGQHSAPARFKQGTLFRNGSPSQAAGQTAWPDAFAEKVPIRSIRRSEAARCSSQSADYRTGTVAGR